MIPTMSLEDEEYTQGLLMAFETRQSVAVQRDGASRLAKKYPL